MPDKLLETLDHAITEVIGPQASVVDATAAFPTATIDALRQQGLLGLISATEVGGMGHTWGDAARVVERLARSCGSSAMVVCMHYCGAAVIERFGDMDTRRAVAAGEHLSTLAFSEAGSRSHFWAPLSTATADGDDVVLDANKSWITSASHATAYVWSSQSVAADGTITLWLVPRDVTGLAIKGPFEGLGLRGNDSAPVRASGVRVPASARLGDDGQGFDVMMGTVLPIFQLCNAAGSLGLMEAITAAAIAHCAGNRFEHLDSALADLPTIRAYLARMRIETDKTRTLWEDTIAAIEGGREDTMLRVLEVKAAAAEAAMSVAALGMRVCGGAAYRKEVGVERRFRDAQAASVMAPTTDVLYDFIGKAICGQELFS
ncbi:acyl-CoA dehydrogenase family protein [Enhygromyxa salina]|uniref:Glutaryl-CoA dehydrogenase n=1 Tax=Enhygromyxa salina TaxID=215803 RepID=A0A2S9XKZ8_9BACT|nr:acyl-CoA dehydrogenase family protein [Enhygromyxa salina]PRP93556.1 Glutaryl-CoA dehydrogenase [Enhygromyxa salina]